MAYVHCHGCNWSQDDFWTRRHNPLAVAWRRIPRHLWPRWEKCDRWSLEERGIPRRLTGVRPVDASGELTSDGFYSTAVVHSWAMVWYELGRMWRVFWRQEWWTWKSFKRRGGMKQGCPKCGHGLCID